MFYFLSLSLSEPHVFPLDLAKSILKFVVCYKIVCRLQDSIRVCCSVNVSTQVFFEVKIKISIALIRLSLRTSSPILQTV